MAQRSHPPEQSSAADRQNAAGEADKPKLGRDKTPSRKGLIALAIALALVGLPTAWAVHVAIQLSRAPVSLVRPHDYAAALDEVLKLQALALSEAKAGEAAFFVSHIGCASPPVWQNKDVLENFKRMRAARVEVTLLGGRKGYEGEPLPSPAWPYEFHEALMATLDLDKQGVDAFFHIREREQYNHSVVAGSERRARAYIASHGEKDIFPTTYFIVKDNEACQEWKRNLLAKLLTPDKPTSPPL